MTFRLADEVLTRQMEGDGCTPAAEHLDLRLLQFGRGVAVYEMPLREQVCDPSGAVAGGVLTTLAEAAMSAAATTTVADDQHASPLVLEICARFDRVVEVGESATVRAEAVVMRTDSRSVRVECEVHCDGASVATFDAIYMRESRPGRVEPVPDDGHTLAHA